eukprot:48786-Pyramimonas_sp.AAC.1
MRGAPKQTWRPAREPPPPTTSEDIIRRPLFNRDRMSDIILAKDSTACSCDYRERDETMEAERTGGDDGAFKGSYFTGWLNNATRDVMRPTKGAARSIQGGGIRFPFHLTLLN